MDAITELMVEKAKRLGSKDAAVFVAKAQRMAKDAVGLELTVRINKNTKLKGVVHSATVYDFRRTLSQVVTLFSVKIEANGRVYPDAVVVSWLPQR